MMGYKLCKCVGWVGGGGGNLSVRMSGLGWIMHISDGLIVSDSAPLR